MDLALNEFTSPFESVGFMTMADNVIETDATLSFNDNKSFYSYIAQVHAREPVILGDSMNFISQDVSGHNYSMTWREFNEQSYINGKYSLEFVANTLEAPLALKFIDKEQLGEPNVYRPFGSTDSKTLDIHTTLDVAGARSFYNNNFKFKLFRGTVTFNRAQAFIKGDIINILDKDIKIVVIEIKVNFDTGVTSYVGIVFAKDN